MSATVRQLIVNADDFGLSLGVNRGIQQSHEQGIVTSASLMVRGPAAKQAAAYGRANSGLSLGLHLDLGEWYWQDEQWKTRYEVVPLDDFAALQRECSRQLDAFVDLVGQQPTHVDSHQHVHQQEPLKSVAADLCSRLAVPLRHSDSRVQYCGKFYGQTTEGDPYWEAISVESLCAVLASLRPGVTELCCHPGFADDLETTYRQQRVGEIETLCDPRVRQELVAQSIQLCSFANFTASHD